MSEITFDFFDACVQTVELSASPLWEQQYVRPIPSKNGVWRLKILLRSGRSRYYYFEDGLWKRKVTRTFSTK